VGTDVAVGVIAVAAGACAAVVLLEAHPAVSATADIAAARPRRIPRMGFPSCK
jgi:hypothetical protein